MSNKFYKNTLYNEEQKLRYIGIQNEKSKDNIIRIFYRSSQIEEQYETDLYNFNIYQIEQLLHYLDPSSVRASRTNFYYVQSYIRWGIKQNLRSDNTNPLDVLSDISYFNKFVDHSRRKLYTKEEIDQIVDTCVNAQDSLVVQLIFEGAYGKAGYSELLNLTKEDILEENTLRLKEDGRERYIEVSDKCIQLIERAITEETYVKKNGNTSANLKSGDTVELVSNNYVLRNVKTRNKDDGIAEAHLVLRRVRAVKEYNELKILTASMIRNSGMLYKAKELYEQYGELEKKQIDEICLHYGVSKVMNNGREYFNSSNYKESFLNLDTIKEFYELDS